MLFFQLLLLGGYAWADALVRRASHKTQLGLAARAAARGARLACRSGLAMPTGRTR